MTLLGIYASMIAPSGLDSHYTLLKGMLAKWFHVLNTLYQEEADGSCFHIGHVNLDPMDKGISAQLLHVCGGGVGRGACIYGI